MDAKRNNQLSDTPVDRLETDSRADEFVYRGGDTVTFLQNSDLQCADCRYAGQHAGICGKFAPKPAAILLRRAVCPEFDPKTVGAAAAVPPPSEEDPVQVHTPQCVDCIRNQGGMNCAMFILKPEELLMNRRPCPAFLSDPADGTSRSE